jgi:hypothetical protein
MVLNIGSNHREAHPTSSSSSCCLYVSDEQWYFPCLCDGSPSGSHGKSFRNRQDALARAEFYDFFPLASSCEQYCFDCGAHKAAHERSYFYVFDDRIEFNTPIILCCWATESCVYDNVQVHYHDKSFNVRKFCCCGPIPSAWCGSPVIRAKTHYAWDCCCCQCGGLSRMRGESIVVAKASLWLLHPSCCVDRCYMSVSKIVGLLSVLPGVKLCCSFCPWVNTLLNFSEVVVTGISNSDAVVEQWAKAVRDYHNFKGIAPDKTSVFETQRMGVVRTLSGATSSLKEPVKSLEMEVRY